jgi:sucrose phosphorylase
MADLIVNHISADSAQFNDVRKNGAQSEYWPMFLRRTDVIPQDADDEVAQIYRPRPGAPFSRLQLDNGQVFDFWTTFSESQLDINVETSVGRDYLSGILNRFSSNGIREIRLDAAGYAIKRRGTNCFMLPETFEFIGDLSQQADSLGMRTLVEIHSHFETQLAIASRVGRVYDFALPPLVLHTMYTGDADALRRWLAISPRNCVTVLDTHDGIGILDIAGYGERAGLLEDEQVEQLVENIHNRTNGGSRRASGNAASNLDIYQVNSTYYDALGRDDTQYLIARAIQFFVPGEPQVYYVGLLAGHNDLELVERTGVGRDINRRVYRAEDIDHALKRPVVRSLMVLMRLRRFAQAFDGDFQIGATSADWLALSWTRGDSSAQLTVDLVAMRADIKIEQANACQRFVIRDGRVSEVNTQAD